MHREEQSGDEADGEAGSEVVATLEQSAYAVAEAPDVVLRFEVVDSGIGIPP